MTIDVPVAVDEGVEDIDVVGELVAGVGFEVAETQIVFCIDEVVEGGRTDEEAVILLGTLNVHRGLNRLVHEVPLVVVQVAVVRIHA